MTTLGAGAPRLRDPFLLVDRTQGRYVLYGTTDSDPWEGPGRGFDAFTSVDLLAWDGPFRVFAPPAGFWGTTQFWAPEVYPHRDGFAMVATFSDGDRRSCHVLHSPSPLGPFVPAATEPVTPEGWSCLDGTLWREADGQLWLVFCHEWTQVGDGTVCAMAVDDDLRSRGEDPVELFAASQAPWSQPVADGDAWVTDGPHLFRGVDGSLSMLWSSFAESGYAMGIARSTSGTVLGPWHHDPDPLPPRDGGHGMVFTSLEGTAGVAWHAPNVQGQERFAWAPLAQAVPRSTYGEHTEVNEPR